jgi:endonuclease YncB( thermonuclease family)
MPQNLPHFFRNRLREAPMRLALIALFAALAFVSPAHANTIGRASVIDGDTIEIHGQRIRFHGIDAPEGRQACSVDGKAWRCGQQSALALSDLIGTKTVRCETKDKDRYQRLVSVCYLGTQSVNAWMVRNGWAVDYRQYSKGAYRAEEAQAKQERLGVWRGEFQMPWDWRRDSRSTSASGQKQTRNTPKKFTANCRIKGNISSRGERIYHVPGGKFYSRTRIDTSKGERWFCTEAEAQAAGWRRSKR